MIVNASRLSKTPEESGQLGIFHGNVFYDTRRWLLAVIEVLKSKRFLIALGHSASTRVNKIFIALRIVYHIRACIFKKSEKLHFRLIASGYIGIHMRK